MSFMYPLGLIGLVGIPIVIIIYILRSKYNEQTVPSVYLWRLSERFLKRKNPLSGLTGLISLILQILTIAVISFAMARPIFVLPNAANDYYFVLDASGSMNMQDGKQTRFDSAKDEIRDVIRKAADGSSYSLVTVDGGYERVFEYVTSKDKAYEIIDTIKSGSASSDTDMIERIAQGYFNDNPAGYIYVVTDKKYDKANGVNLITVGEGGDNYAVWSGDYSHSGGRLTVNADVISYSSDATLSVGLYLDGADTPSVETEVQVTGGERAPVTLECPALRFSSFEVRVNNTDMYSADNSTITYNLKSEKTYSTLIVSENGFFIRAVIDANVDSDIKVISPEEYEDVTESYGLYVFDCFEPETLPDGSVWLINADKSINDAGFGIRGKVDIGEPAEIKKSTSTATAVRTLLDGVDGKDIYIKNYVKYSGMYLNFSTLFTYDGSPIIFAGTNGLGNRQVVFGFDINEADLALSRDFVILLGNLIEYSFPSVIDTANLTAGEDAVVNIVANSSDMQAFAPSGEEVYLESDGAVATLSLDEVGTYTVKMTIAGQESTYRIYSGAHPSESQPTVKESSIEITGEPSDDRRDGEFDPLTILFIALAVLFIADWGVYCYEKYQLR